MIKDFDDLLLFLYFSKQKIDLAQSSLQVDPASIIVPFLQQLSPEQVQQKYEEGIQDYVLMRLFTIIKFELSKSLIAKGIKVGNNDQISNLIKKARGIASPTESGVLDLMEILRCVRNSFEYRKGIVGSQDVNNGKQLKVTNNVFEVFFIEQNGCKTIVKSLPVISPKNASLMIGVSKTEIFYNVGDQCKPIPVEALFCDTVLISSFFQEFNK